MSDSQNNSNLDESSSAFLNVAKALEQIIETVPDDLVALEMLAHIYEKTGDQDKMHKHLLSLGEVIVRDGDAHLAEYIYDRMKNIGLCEDMEADVCKLVEQLSVRSSSIENDSYDDLIVSDSSYAFKMVDELSFAWRIFEAGELTQEEYASVAHDLSEMTADGHLSTISVLHCLEARAFGGMERVMGFVARDVKVPIVTLPLFDIKESAYSLLPIDFMIRRGVIVYDLIGDDALVVVMNPVDQALRRQVESKLKKVCHYYISLPAEFDAVIRRISEN